jgi:hypothetical protein
MEALAVAFGRVLRGLGVNVPVGHVLDFTNALAVVGVGRAQRRVLGGAVHAAAPTGGPADLRPRVRVFWERAVPTGGEEIEEIVRISLATDEERRRDAEERGAGRRADGAAAVLATEVLAQKDFAAYDDTELHWRRR